MFSSVNLVYWLLFWNRQRHARLLNSLDAARERVQQMGAQLRLCDWAHLTALNFTVSLVYFTLFLASCISILDDLQRDTVVSLGYVTIYMFGVCKVLLGILHVRDLLLLIGDIFVAGIIAVRASVQENVFVEPEQLHLLEVARQCLDEVGECFGEMLVVCGIKDVIILTIMLFYLLAKTLYEVNHDGWFLWWFVAMYAIPILLTNALIFGVFDWLENMVHLLPRELAKRPIKGWRDDLNDRVCCVFFLLIEAMFVTDHNL